VRQVANVHSQSSQKAVDDLQSPYTMDSVTLFGMRPPELRFVMNQALCAKWFKRVPFAGNLTKQIETCNKNLHLTRLELSSWIDATTATVRVRKLAVPLVIAHLETCEAMCFHHSATAAGPTVFVHPFSFDREVHCLQKRPMESFARTRQKAKPQPPSRTRILLQKIHL